MRAAALGSTTGQLPANALTRRVLQRLRARRSGKAERPPQPETNSASLVCSELASSRYFGAAGSSSDNHASII